MLLGGIWATTVTPFKENEDVDEDSLRNLIDYYIDSGVHGLIVLGVMGEADKLSESEKSYVTNVLLEQTNKRIPVAVTCTAQGTKVAEALAKEAERAGAQAVMIAPPDNLNDEGLLFRHYFEISKNISIPIIVQDNPSVTGSKMSSTLLARMAEKIENVNYVKLEEVPTTTKISNTLQQTDKLKIFGGPAIYFYEELSRGASGTMTGFALPETMVKIYNLFNNNEKDEARDLFYSILPLIRLETLLDPMARKEIFKLKGVIKSNHARLPHSSFDEESMHELKQTIDYVNSAIKKFF